MPWTRGWGTSACGGRRCSGWGPYYWCSACSSRHQGVPQLGVAIPLLGASLLVFVLVSLGLPTFSAVEATAGVLLTIALVIASIGVHQAMSPLTCFRCSPSEERVPPTDARAQTPRTSGMSRGRGPRTSGSSANIPACSRRTRFKDGFVIEAFCRIPTSSPGRFASGRRWPSRSSGASAPPCDSCSWPRCFAWRRMRHQDAVRILAS